MSIPVLSGEKAEEEYKPAYDEHALAVTHAASILKSKGMASDEFREADAAVGALWARLRELQGMGGKDWMT